MGNESDGRSEAEWIEVDLPHESAPKLETGLWRAINENDFLAHPGSKEAVLLEEGKCGVCEGPLEEETIRLSSGRGTIAVTCSVICLDDGLIMGYLNEQMEDVGQRVILRRQGVRESEDKE